MVVSLFLVCFPSRLILDRINRFEKRQHLSKSLEDEWSRSVKLKHRREEEEKRFLRFVDIASLWTFITVHPISYIDECSPFQTCLFAWPAVIMLVEASESVNVNVPQKVQIGCGTQNPHNPEAAPLLLHKDQFTCLLKVLWSSTPNPQVENQSLLSLTYVADESQSVGRLFI